ncbi:ribosome maturation factor RimP [Spirochaetia bacterium]|nr:ribosome maturation factor RimP [Spirochaetia bacterium]
MRFNPRKRDSLFDSLEGVVKALGMRLIELNSSSGKREVHVRIIVDRVPVIGIDDCARVHRALIPRLDIAFPGKDITIEVSSPGANRRIKDASEFESYIGRNVRCFRTDIQDWVSGIIESASGISLCLNIKTGIVEIPYEIIANAQLCQSDSTDKGDSNIV